MTNSEKIDNLLQKNVPSRTSELRKVQLLEIAVEFGTIEDIEKAYNRYGVFEFTGGALALACWLGSLEKVQALLAHDARFYPRGTSELSGEIKRKYNPEMWFYMSLSLQRWSPYSLHERAKEIIRAERFEEIPQTILEDSLRAEIIEHILRKHTDNEEVTSVYDDMGILLWLPKAFPSLFWECLKRGIKIPYYYFKKLNSVDYGEWFLHGVVHLPIEDCRNVLKMMIEIAESYGEKLFLYNRFFDFSPDEEKQIYNEVMLPLILDHCEIKDVPQKTIIETATRQNNLALLDILADRGFFATTKAYNNACKYAESNHNSFCLKWLIENKDRIIKHIPHGEQQSKNKAADSPTATWFTHKASKLTGVSKKGLKCIREQNLTSIELPSVMDGITIDTIAQDAFQNLKTDLPNIVELIIPSSYTHFPRPFPDVTSIKRLKLMTFDGDFFYWEHSCHFNDAIEHIDIENSTLYSCSDGIIYNKDSTRLVFYPRGKVTDTFILPSSVQVIGRNALCRCHIRHLIIPDTVQIIEESAAWDSRIKHLEIGAGVEKISNNAFSGCGDMKTIVFHEGLQVIGEKAFSFCGAAEIHFPNSLKRIEKDAFRDSKGCFFFPNDDVLIGPHSFYGCKKKNTHYSTKIEGKMQRCGYSQFDYYDEYLGVTRDEYIVQLQQLTNDNSPIPENVRVYELIKMIKQAKI